MGERNTMAINAIDFGQLYRDHMAAAAWQGLNVLRIFWPKRWFHRRVDGPGAGSFV